MLFSIVCLFLHAQLFAFCVSTAYILTDGPLEERRLMIKVQKEKRKIVLQ